MKIIGLVSQKGGVGKTTIALAFAGYLAYKLGYRVLVVDMDEEQLSIARQRQEEQLIMESQYGESLKEIVKAHNKPLYDVMTIESDEELKNKLEPIVTSEEELYDYIIIDTKGAISNRLLLALSVMDYIIVPASPTATSARSTGTMAELIQKQISEEIIDAKFNIIWTKYRSSPVIEEEMEALARNYFPTSNDKFVSFGIPERVNIPRRNIINTLFFPIESELKKSAPELLIALENFHEIVKAI